MAEELKLMEKGSRGIHAMTIGASKEEGGSRSVTLKTGGVTCLPFLFEEGSIPHRPLIAGEICDKPEPDWPEYLTEDLGTAMNKPEDWAVKMVQEAGADLVCLRLLDIHPDAGNASAKDAAALTVGILKRIKAPMVVLGCGQADKDNEVLPQVSEATKGERLLFGDVVQENYKTLAAACIADGHNIIAESPIDVNIAKQLNILLSDLGMPLDRIAMNPTIGPLGYGLEYAYSIMERARLAALSGDKMLAMPFICLVGQEVWRVKEVRVSEKDFPTWGDAHERSVMWEVVTAMSMLQAGADILTMAHPKAIKIVKAAIDELMKGT
jgi:acetyl-CoA decarbonylase/synthase complex subunit delta